MMLGELAWELHPAQGADEVFFATCDSLFSGIAWGKEHSTTL